jgi:succinate dehydrogenase / fumarate reductase, cytochrome b subunit
MTIISSSSREAGLLRLLKMMPLSARYARNRGGAFIISWCHRLTGILLVLFLLFHIYTLSSLSAPGAYESMMTLYKIPVLGFLEWALAVPVIFHALNGGRLILYESFRFRRNDVLLNWVAGLTLLYAAFSAALMVMGDQSVSPVFFWTAALAAGLTAAYGLYSRIRRTFHEPTWKFQRISGAFLLVMVPAHFLFMHLNPQIAKEAQEVVLRMQNPFIKLIDAVLVVSALYHGGYGLASILHDYAASKRIRVTGTTAVALAMAIAAWAGLKLLFYSTLTF